MTSFGIGFIFIRVVLGHPRAILGAPEADIPPSSFGHFAGSGKYFALKANSRRTFNRRVKARRTVFWWPDEALKNHGF